MKLLRLQSVDCSLFLREKRDLFPSRIAENFWVFRDIFRRYFWTRCAILHMFCPKTGKGKKKIVNLYKNKYYICFKTTILHKNVLQKKKNVV